MGIYVVDKNRRFGQSPYTVIIAESPGDAINKIVEMWGDEDEDIAYDALTVQMVSSKNDYLEGLRDLEGKMKALLVKFEKEAKWLNGSLPNLDSYNYSGETVRWGQQINRATEIAEEMLNLLEAMREIHRLEFDQYGDDDAI